MPDESVVFVAAANEERTEWLEYVRELPNIPPPGKPAPKVDPAKDKQLQKAVGCTLEKAEAFAIEVDSTGRAVVYSGSEAECEKVANVLRQIRLQVETDKSA